MCSTPRGRREPARLASAAIAVALCTIAPVGDMEGALRDLPHLSSHPQLLSANAATLEEPATRVPVTNPSALDNVTPGFPIADLANVFARRQEERIAEQLRNIEQSSGIKIRILTQAEGSVPGIAIKSFFGLDDDSILIVADLRGGNILNFNVGRNVRQILPESFWIELGNRYGSSFYVRDFGEDGSVLAAVDGIVKCVESGKICKAVPGYGRDQFTASAVCAAVGGAVAGAAARTGGSRFNLPWLALFSPLWSIFFVSFGLLPVVAREGFFVPDAAGIVASFSATAVAVWLWIPVRFGDAGVDKTTPDI